MVSSMVGDVFSISHWTRDETTHTHAQPSGQRLRVAPRKEKPAKETSAGLKLRGITAPGWMPSDARAAYTSFPYIVLAWGRRPGTLTYMARAGAPFRSWGCSAKVECTPASRS